jgi:hypothetical protein
MRCPHVFKSGNKHGTTCGGQIMAHIRLIDGSDRHLPDLDIEYACSLHHRVPRPRRMPSGIYGLEELLQEELDKHV